jgi:hypothetical protein
MDKKQVQEAIGRIDQAVAQLTCNRQTHITLVNDMQLIQQCCMKQFEEPEDGGTNIIPISPTTGDENSEGSGDGI